MNIIEHTRTELGLKNIILRFSSLVGLSKLTKKANFRRRSSISLTKVLAWLIQTKFLGRSLYRAMPDPDCTIRTVRNDLNDGRINWQRLTCLVGAAIIKHLRPYIDARRRFAFILDDTLFARDYSTKTELLARVFNHDDHVYQRGFRALTLAWSDGNTLLPVDYALMSSKSAAQRLGSPAKTTSGRSIAGQRRVQAQGKMNDVSVELLTQALANHIPAHYVLFDSWFSSPRMFYTLKTMGLACIGMIKRTKKIYYRYRGRLYSVKDLYERFCASRRQTHTNYQYSPIVTAYVNLDDGTQAAYPLKLVFVTNRKNASSYLVLATTQTNLRPEEIIQMYGRRWQIEGYFKVAKQYLRLDKSQIQSYDGLCGHLAVVMMTYDLLAWQQRLNEDERTLGDLFYEMNEVMPDIAVTQALAWLLKALSALGATLVGTAEEVINNIVDHFVSFLPKNLVNLLGI